jgi:hypothetical protein
MGPTPQQRSNGFRIRSRGFQTGDDAVNFGRFLTRECGMPILAAMITMITPIGRKMGNHHSIGVAISECGESDSAAWASIARHVERHKMAIVRPRTLAPCESKSEQFRGAFGYLLWLESLQELYSSIFSGVIKPV